MKKGFKAVFVFVCFLVFILFIARISSGAVEVVNYSDYYTVVKTSAMTVTGTGTPSDIIDTGAYEAGSLQVIWSDMTTGGATVTATYEVRVSTDGTYYDTVSGSSTTTSGTSGTDTIEFTSIAGHYLRVYVTGTNASSGTLRPYFIGRRNRP